MELDVSAICGECTEYSDYATCVIDDMIGDYGYIYTKEEEQDIQKVTNRTNITELSSNLSLLKKNNKNCYI